MLIIKDVYFTADNTEILKNINLNINEGDCISIIGPSGSGKSTLLKLCSDLISPQSGALLYKDKNYTEYKPIELRKEISYCIQAPVLFGNTVYDNLSFPFIVRKKAIDDARINKLLNEFNLSKEYLQKEINSLSGGEKQRISLIRNLIFPPKILLLDEATSALDNENSIIIERYIQKLNSDGVTVLWITHSFEQSSRIFNKRITLNAGRINRLEDLN